MNKGFTLVELIITITILVIIMLLAVPNIINMVARNRESQLERTHQLVCEAARVYAHKRGSCLEFGGALINTQNEETRIINFSNCNVTSQGANVYKTTQFFVDQSLLSNTLTDPTRGNGRYDYESRVQYGVIGDSPRELTITLTGNFGNHVCHEGD